MAILPKGSERWRRKPEKKDGVRNKMEKLTERGQRSSGKETRKGPGILIAGIFLGRIIAFVGFAKGSMSPS